MVTFEPRTMRKNVTQRANSKCKGRQVSKGWSVLETERRPVCLESKEQVKRGKSQRLRLAQCCRWQCWGGSEASEGATRRF